ncbi:MAG: hypothetical protein IH840_10270 [Candidatus Heimdallarchaeota archaeon]|nr:hypothetical protein [Candidatus Heimdallarchaeota archaeon]
MGHEVLYELYFSSDNGTTWELLASDLTTTTFDWDTTTVSNGDYLIKVVAKDTEGTNIEVISLSFTIETIISTNISDATKSDDTSTSSPSDTITSSTDSTTTSASETETSNPASSGVNAVAMIFGLMSIAVINFTRKKYDNQKL